MFHEKHFKSKYNLQDYIVHFIFYTYYMSYSNQSLTEYTEYHTRFILIKYIFTNLTIYFIN